MTATYQKITINHDLVSGTSDVVHVDIPILIALSDLAKEDSNDLFDVCRSDGGDIRVTKADGETQLAREIVAIDTTAKNGEMWVKIHQLPAAIDTEILVWYDGVSTEPAADSAYGSQAVWNDNYKLVYHFNDTPSGAAPQIKDSTANGNHGTVHGVTDDNLTTVVGNALDMGSGSYIEANDSDSLDISYDLTLQAIAKTNEVSSQDTGLISKFTDALGSQNYAILKSSNDAYPKFSALSTSSGIVSVTGSTALNDNQLHKIDAVFTPSTSMEVFVDGVINGSKTSGVPSYIHIGSAPFRVNTVIDTTRSWVGTIDEIRVVSDSLSDDWLLTEYNNIFQIDSFYTVEGEDEYQLPAPTFSPESGGITSGSTVTISCSTSNTVIYYTTDGTNPTTESSQYTTPITITEQTTIKALAVKDGTTYSSIVAAIYTIGSGFGSEYSNYQIVTVNSSLVAGDDSTIHIDFPLYIDLSLFEKTIGTDIFDICRDDGGDIRATMSDGETQLAREIVSIDKTAKTGEMWVKIPQLPAYIDLSIFVWFNGTNQEPSPLSEYGSLATWNDNYKLVYHFNEVVSTGDDTGDDIPIDFILFYAWADSEYSDYSITYAHYPTAGEAEDALLSLRDSWGGSGWEYYKTDLSHDNIDYHILTGSGDFGPGGEVAYIYTYGDVGPGGDTGDTGDVTTLDIYEGGYLVGIVDSTEGKYELIVAPKSSGEVDGIDWGPIQSTVSGADSTWNGSQNTADLIADTESHPAAEFCNNLTIDGYSDWYLPAADELEMIYRKFKPTTEDNITTWCDLHNQNNGYNPNSDPATTAYNTSTPSQTSLTDWQSGGSEAFDGAYWSSTEFDNNEAWAQQAGHGWQYSYTKSYLTFKARAVRRVFL